MRTWEKKEEEEIIIAQNVSYFRKIRQSCIKIMRDYTIIKNYSVTSFILFYYAKRDWECNKKLV